MTDDEWRLAIRRGQRSRHRRTAGFKGHDIGVVSSVHHATSRATVDIPHMTFTLFSSFDCAILTFDLVFTHCTCGYVKHDL